MSEEKNRKLASAEELRGRKSGAGEKKTGKPSRILILIPVLLVLAGVLYAVSNVKPAAPETTQPPTASGASSEMVSLIARTRGEVSSVTVTPSEGPGYTLLQKEDGSYEILDHPGFDLDRNKAEALIGYAAVLTANRRVTEKAENLADYGLDKPLSRVEIQYTDGRSDVWLVGTQPPTSTASYFMKEGTGEVFLLYPSAIRSFSETLLGMHVLQMPCQVDSKRIRRLLIEKTGEAPLEIGYSEEGSADKGYSVSAMRIRQPFYYTANVERCGEILNGCAGLTISGYAGEADQMADTGLESGSARIRLTLDLLNENGEKQTCVYRVGTFADSDRVYVAVDDTQAVYLAPASTVAFLDLATPEYMVDTFSNLIYIQAVEKVEVSTKEETWELAIQRETDSNGKSKEYCLFNGRILTDNRDFRQLYQQLIGLTSSKLSDNYALDGETVLSVRYTLNVEPYELPVEYLSFDEDYCALRRDGVTLFLVKREQVEHLIREMQTFAEKFGS